MDMSKTITPKSDQLNFDDFIGNESITIKVTKVNVATGDQPVSIHFENDNGKPYKPCKSMRRALVFAWGNDSKNYIGRSMTLFGDTKVKWAGAEVGGIRISHLSDIKENLTLALTASKGNRKPYIIKPLHVDLELQDLMQKGKESASKGMEEYTIWGKALTPEQKEKVKNYLGTWTTIAKEADSTKEIK